MDDYFKTGDQVLVAYYDTREAHGATVEGEFVGFGVDPKDDEPFVVIRPENGVERRVGLDFFEGITDPKQADVAAEQVAESVILPDAAQGSITNEERRTATKPTFVESPRLTVVQVEPSDVGGSMPPKDAA